MTSVEELGKTFGRCRFVRAYEPKYPLEALDAFLYPSLLRDGNNIVLSENITWFTSTETHSLNKLSEEIELKVKKSCQNVEVAYHDSSGNRWVFLILKGNQSKSNLRRMQAIYKKLYRRMSAQTQREQ